MSNVIWLAVGLYLLLEGLGPLFFPKAWRKMILDLANQPDNLLRRIGGILFVSGVIICIMLLSRDVI